MPDLLQKAPSGRAKCRGCGQTIAKGALRFGESAANAYAEGETHSWFHLSCGALMRPSKLLPVLEASAEPVDEQAWLLATARFGAEHERLPRLTRAERASSGRAHCRACHELIAKGEWRFALQMFEEGRPSPLGTIHASCALAYFGTGDVMSRVRRLSPELDEQALAEIEQALAQCPGPGLAKTQTSDVESAERRGAGEG